MVHELKRNLVWWGSCGKFHDEPMVERLVKDISDSHLLHIIPWIKTYPHAYDVETLQLMEDEQEYRRKNYIFVEAYK
jgi:hypothetical protein